MTEKHSFIKAACAGKNSLGLFIISFIVVVLGWIIAQGIALGIIISRKGMGIIDMETQGLNPDLLDNLDLGLLLLSFGGGSVALWFCLKVFHLRSFKSIITPLKRINWSKIFFAAFIWFVLMVLTELVSYLLFKDLYTFSFQWKQFIPLFFVALIFIPIQASFEEFFIRGYLLQGIGQASRSPWLSLIVTSLIFGLLHIANPEIKAMGLGVLTFYIGFGVFLGLITLMDESLEIPLGIHAMNNFYAAVFVTFPSSALPTKAMWTMSEMNSQYSMIAMVLIMFIGYFIFSWKYKWTDYAKLNERIEWDETPENPFQGSVEETV